MIRPGHFFVHPRCEQLVESLMRWDYTERHKDAIDALRYGLQSFIFRGDRGKQATTQRLYLY